MSEYGSEFRVIETLGWSAFGGAARINRHLARMQATCAELGIDFPEEQLRHLVNGVTGFASQRLRLTVDPDGQGALEQFDMPDSSAKWTVSIASQRLDSADPWLRRKTTKRALYLQARSDMPAGVDEVLFLNERDELCEGTISNIFVRRNVRLLTPPVSCGLLPGILRQELLDVGRAEEEVLTVKDLKIAKAIFFGNSLRSLIPAEVIFSDDQRV
ncbi:4-amino-4-deoxychorismate lyase [Pacificibacter maritimus]|uniref:Probable branched-chain-amino-acid aminotransferase n=1 Tax=Pacificibacter maritimus TaxID=762213 RepID=A0A3N4U997_9RHOB|nr:aminotransferase class IV family protein [Pacificibacter maritimus]RPE67042.1 4-amino-4-deoxychorismate lyase [Pacificibacter maritimus]